jgi:hypothetical protein
VHRKPDPQDVFLNFPCDDQFRKLYLGYIAGICSFGLAPRATLEIPGGERRLDRIADLIRSCRYSVHDLSRVELDLHRPRTPRFNMPFELGLTVMAAIEHPARHTWFVFESKARRHGVVPSQVIEKSETACGAGRVCGAVPRGSSRTPAAETVPPGIVAGLSAVAPLILFKISRPVVRSPDR